MLGVFDSAGPLRARVIARSLIAFWHTDTMGFLKREISELNTQPTDTPVQRFKCDLTTALTWLGARVVRYTFPVRLFHSRLHAGLSRRYPVDFAHAARTEGYQDFLRTETCAGTQRHIFGTILLR